MKYRVTKADLEKEMAILTLATERKYCIDYGREGNIIVDITDADNVIELSHPLTKPQLLDWMGIFLQGFALAKMLES
jgi:hypothetical protein